MTEQELEKSRRETWHTNGLPIATFEDARAFVDAVGLCLMYPLPPPVLLPSFLGAVAGDDRGLPTAKQAFADERAQRATELANRLVAQRAAFESNIFAENCLLLSPTVFPYFYVLASERAPGARREPLSQIANITWKTLSEDGPKTREQLRERLGAEFSIAAVERAVGELWMRLRIMPVHSEGQQQWETLERWAPEVVAQGARLPMAVALSALISQYLQGVVAAEGREIEDFFSHFAARSKIKEATNALLAAREFEFVNVGHRSLLRLSETPSTVVHPVPRRQPRREKPRS
jgi:hypothetical protein